MHLTIYGDFNCPCCYLASQRADSLAAAGRAEVEWRAVEHDRRLGLAGTPASLDPGRWQHELAAAAGLAGPDEQVPGTVPALVTNTGAAVAAYAEAVTDGVADELRRSVFAEIWVRRRHLSSPQEVRRLVCALMYPAAAPGSRREQLAAPDLPARVHHHAAPGLLPRLSGCTISPDGGPLTTGGHERIRRWREEWLAGSGGAVPALSVPGQGMLTGAAALDHLAGLAIQAPRARVRAAQAPAGAGVRAAISR